MQDLQDKISILQKQLAHEKQNQTLGSTSSPGVCTTVQFFKLDPLKLDSSISNLPIESNAADAIILTV